MMVVLIQIFVAIVFFLFLYKLWQWYKKKMAKVGVDEQVGSIEAEEIAANRIPKDLKKKSEASKKKLKVLNKINSK